MFRSSDELLNRQVDSAERKEQIHHVISGKFDRRGSRLSRVRVHYQNQFVGVGVSCVRHHRHNLGHLLALLCKFNFLNTKKLLNLHFFQVYDSPEMHPRIHPQEREYIIQTLGSSVMRGGEKRPKVPWKAILRSRPVWINALAQWGGIWGLFTLLTQAPTYFRFIHGWGIKMTGILSGMPHLLRVGFSMAFSSYGDYLLASNKMSRQNVRRLAAFVSKVGS